MRLVLGVQGATRISVHIFQITHFSVIALRIIRTKDKKDEYWKLLEFK
jgi:hypothetical protein